MVFELNQLFVEPSPLVYIIHQSYRMVNCAFHSFFTVLWVHPNHENIVKNLQNIYYFGPKFAIHKILYGGTSK